MHERTSDAHVARVTVEAQLRQPRDERPQRDLELGAREVHAEAVVHAEAERQRDRRPAVTLTFGFGIHYCLGVHLARAELEIALRVLVKRLPKLRFDGDTSDVRITGSFVQLLRGPNKLPVRFD